MINHDYSLEIFFPDDKILFMASAEIITIGTEILLGEIQDTNTALIARTLKENGIDLYRTHTIGDNINRISQSIQDSLQRADIIITTGGLGPTVDDPTREAVALALGQPLEFHPELWEIICQYFAQINRKASENNRNQAYLPAGAKAIPNPVGTAPGIYASFREQTIFCLPGVPREMEYMLTQSVIPTIRELFPLHQIIHTRLLRVSGMGESQVDVLISDFERLSNPTIGLVAHPGLVDIRIGAKAESETTANQIITSVENQIRALLGENIYGCDDETLITAIKKTLPSGYNMGLIEAGFEGSLINMFTENSIFKHIYQQQNLILQESMEQVLREKQKEWQIPCIVGCSYYQINGISHLFFGVFREGLYNSHERRIAGPPQNGKQWAIQIVLDFIRRIFIKPPEDK